MYLEVFLCLEIAAGNEGILPNVVDEIAADANY